MQGCAISLLLQGSGCMCRWHLHADYVNWRMNETQSSVISDRGVIFLDHFVVGYKCGNCCLGNLV